MPKFIFILFIIIALLGCIKNNQNTKETAVQPMEEIHNPVEKTNNFELEKYGSVQQMLLDANDFNTENGTLVFIDENPNNLHIQVSKPIIEGDLEHVIHEIVKRDIVYVAFQTFAKTPIKKITITSIPINWQNNKKYYPQFKRTITVNKNTTDQILEDEFGTSDHSILFNEIDNVQIPRKQFDRLKSDKLEDTFSKLK